MRTVRARTVSWIDDVFSKQGLTGLAIGGKATDFELDSLEVTRAEFASIVAKTDDDGGATMRNVKLLDVYIHDTGSEGIYFGGTQKQPQHAFENLHNVLGPGAVRWRSAFAQYQDGNVQYGQRYGSGKFYRGAPRHAVPRSRRTAARHRTRTLPCGKHCRPQPTTCGSPREGLGVRWPPAKP